MPDTMTQEMRAAVHRLQALPEEDQTRIGNQINAYLTKLERLRELVREGLESGPATPLDMEAVIRRAEAKLDATQGPSED